MQGEALCQVAQSTLRERLPELRMEVIDTLNVSMCQGWMAIEAVRTALEGKALSEVVELVRGMIRTARMIQTADTLNYPYRGFILP